MKSDDICLFTSHLLCRMCVYLHLIFNIFIGLRISVQKFTIWCFVLNVNSSVYREHEVWSSGLNFPSRVHSFGSPQEDFLLSRDLAFGVVELLWGIYRRPNALNFTLTFFYWRVFHPKLYMYFDFYLFSSVTSVSFLPCPNCVV